MFYECRYCEQATAIAHTIGTSRPGTLSEGAQGIKEAGWCGTVRVQGHRGTAEGGSNGVVGGGHGTEELNGFKRDSSRSSRLVDPLTPHQQQPKCTAPNIVPLVNLHGSSTVH